MDGADVLASSLDQLGANAERFAREFVADLARRHADVLRDASGEARTTPADAERVLAVLRAFANRARSAPATESDAASSSAAAARASDPAVLALADSLMKTFAHVLGRARWTPAMALAWNAAVRRDGARLLRDLLPAAAS